MENKEVKTWHILVFMALCTAMLYMIYYKPEVENITIVNNCKEDSLQSVIDNMQISLREESRDRDKIEAKYESNLFEYEYGLKHIKETHPSAYREFHRIIAFKENFDRESESENIKRLKLHEQYR